MSKEDELRAWVGTMSDRYPAARGPAVAADEDDASARANPSSRDLIAEGRALYEQCQRAYSDLQLANVPTQELRDFRDRIQTTYARLQQRPTAPELRRVITDLRNALRDMQDRDRQIEGGGLDGHVDIVDQLELENDHAPSNDPEADGQALIEELRGIMDRVHRVSDALQRRIPAPERDAFLQRERAIGAVFGERPSTMQMRRTITDAHDLLNDLTMRAREVQRGGGQAPNDDDGGAVAQDGAGLYRQANELYASLQQALAGQDTELENYRRQVDSLWGRIERGNRAEAERSLVDLRGMIQDMQRRLRETRR